MKAIIAISLAIGAAYFAYTRQYDVAIYFCVIGCWNELIHIGKIKK